MLASFSRARIYQAATQKYASTSSTLGSAAKPPSYSSTLLLPRTRFPLWSNAQETEGRLRLRTCDDLYRWQLENAPGELFVLHDGPPYANGALHMGHALNKILKDIINRYNVSRNRRVHYIPGWDCHGLPIENKALQELDKEPMSLTPTEIRSAAGTVAAREVESQKEQFKKLGIMADWDNSTTTYRTLDHSYEIRQLRIFQKMVEQGHIYRAYRPVHYSPSSRSALAEAELVYKDNHTSHSVYVFFDYEPAAEDELKTLLTQTSNESARVRLLVWTTTPWTLTANMAIAMNPELEYVAVKRQNVQSDQPEVVVVARDLLGALADALGPVEIIGSTTLNGRYKPIFSALTSEPKLMKIIPAAHVNATSGTGLVHCAPAHGYEDYDAFHWLSMLGQQDLVCHVDAQGRFTADVANVVGESAASTIVGKEVLNEGSRAVVKILKGVGSLLKVERYKHRYPYDWKTDQPIIVTATSQWFTDMRHIKDAACEALNTVSFFPEISRNRLTSFVKSRAEWCISRQRVWGVPIPALYRVADDSSVLSTESLDHILTVLEKKGVQYWWDGPVEEFIPPNLRSTNEEWRKGTDTMDVWFDSGTSWTMLKGLDASATPPASGTAAASTEQSVGGTRDYYADVCLEGSDQHRGWFQSQLLTAVGSGAEKKPYKQLITHGMVLDQQGKKMSKSLGNIVSPMVVVNGGKDLKREPAYGADVLRLWAATVEYWRDIAIGPTVLDQTAEALRKIRNCARFVLGNIGDEEARAKRKAGQGKLVLSEMRLVERFMMHELYVLERSAIEAYESYNFPKVVSALANFTNTTLSSLYFDITKDCLYADAADSWERQQVAAMLEQILSTTVRICAPILPHLAEEVYEHLEPGASGKSIFMTKWEPIDPSFEDASTAHEMRQLLTVRSTVMGLLEKARGNKQLKSSLEAEVDLILPSEGLTGSQVQGLLQREENFLRTLFIVSDVCLTDEGSLGTTSPSWLYTDSVAIPGCDDEIAVRVRPATKQKCPRCWTFTRQDGDHVCPRCKSVVQT
ncbi:hypothetical protein HGRIS_000337 [Hohenbuehelia grisea]|uniref:isoleucine--tRNA ligase n=1 Tax=Hohenbuehelia grisea TaxID=104357 RepID=A0ABR3JQR3_9AGAR